MATEDELKRKFANAMIQPGFDPFRAALKLFPGDTGAALSASMAWITDPDVLAMAAEVSDADREDADTVTPEKLRKALWLDYHKTNLAENKVKIADAITKSFAAEKEQAAPQAVVNNYVMAVPSYENVGDWEAAAKRVHHKNTTAHDAA